MSSKYVLLVLVLFMFSLTSTQGYSSEGGIELEDTAIMDYLFYLDDLDNLVSEGDNYVLTVTPVTLTEGLYQGLLGMKPGDHKVIHVPPELGFQNEDHPYFNRTQIWDVTIIDVTCCVQVQTQEGSDEGSNNPTSAGSEKGNSTVFTAGQSNYYSTQENAFFNNGSGEFFASFRIFPMLSGLLGVFVITALIRNKFANSVQN